MANLRWVSGAKVLVFGEGNINDGLGNLRDVEGGSESDTLTILKSWFKELDVR